MKIITGFMLSLDVDGKFNMTAVDDNLGLQQYIATVMCPQRPILTNMEVKASIEAAILEFDKIVKQEGYDVVCSTITDPAVQAFLDDSTHTSMYVDYDDENTYWTKITLPELKYDYNCMNEDEVIDVVRECCERVEHVAQGQYVAYTKIGKKVDITSKDQDANRKSACVQFVHEYNGHKCTERVDCSRHMELLIRTTMNCYSENR